MRGGYRFFNHMPERSALLTERLSAEEEIGNDVRVYNDPHRRPS